MSKVEERLLNKLSAKFIEMMQVPKAKSIEFELIKAVFATRLASDASLFQLVRETLLK